MSVLRNARATSAGGVIHRTGTAGEEIVLAHRHQSKLWALPKGTPNAGETLAETALRETREESGLEVEIERRLTHINYVFVHSGTRYHKTVHFFLMRPVGGSLESHDHEFDDVRWLPASEALAVMTYPTERAVVEEALAVLTESTASDLVEATTSGPGG